MSKYPLAFNRTGTYPSDSRCPTCNATFANGVAYLSAGAVLLSKNEQNSLHSDRLRAHLLVGFHGKDPSMRDSGGVTIVDDLRGGQFDLNWCSIACMRQWLIKLLDEVEADVAKRD